MKAEEFLKEKSDWFDKSPGGEKLYFESEVIKMMNEYANEALRIHAVSGRSEQLVCPACDSQVIVSDERHNILMCGVCKNQWAN